MIIAMRSGPRGSYRTITYFLISICFTFISMIKQIIQQTNCYAPFRLFSAAGPEAHAHTFASAIRHAKMREAVRRLYPEIKALAPWGLCFCFCFAKPFPVFLEFLPGTLEHVII